MSKNIEDISIFGEYKQPENRVTAALLQILKIGGEDLLRYLSTKIGFNIPSSEIEIISQVTNDRSIPDGLLKSNFSFRLFIESKIKSNSIDQNQLDNHLKEINSNNDFLIYFTPDDNNPIKDNKVNWYNWKGVMDLLNEYINNSKIDNYQILSFLVLQFNTLLENFNLLGKTWNLNNNNVLIVAASSAENVAMQYNYYICQNKRSFKPSKYLAFYNSNTIKYIFEILENPKDNIDLKKISDLKDYLVKVEPNYDGDLRKIFKLKLYKEVDPILNDSIDKNGNLCPYTYGQPRYSNLELILKAKKTSEL